MEKKVYSTSGKELRTITLDDKVFGLPVNDDVIYYAITIPGTTALENYLKFFTILQEMVVSAKIWSKPS